MWRTWTLWWVEMKGDRVKQGILGQTWKILKKNSLNILEIFWKFPWNNLETFWNTKLRKCFMRYRCLQKNAPYLLLKCRWTEFKCLPIILKKSLKNILKIFWMNIWITYKKFKNFLCLSDTWLMSDIWIFRSRKKILYLFFAQLLLPSSTIW